MATERRLIDADALKLAIRDDAEINGANYARVKQHINEAKTVDAEKVVYCKDCARCKRGYCTIRKDSWGATLLVGQHDFCSDGERKENGN